MENSMPSVPIQTKDEFIGFIEDLELTQDSVPQREIIRESAFFPPDFDDLYRLYRLVRDFAVISAIEYGAGWSTVALSKGIWENKKSFGPEYSMQRNAHPFQLHSIDASKFFLNRAFQRVPIQYQSVIKSKWATPKLITDLNQCVVLWFPPQRVDYDLIYIDGPDPEQVVREESDFPISTVYDLPIMGDLALFESYILPKTLILFDGRTANYRHLKRKLIRNWNYYSNVSEDYGIMLLDEEPLGEINKKHLDFREMHSVSAIKNLASWNI
jgi:hypothetical protein